MADESFVPLRTTAMHAWIDRLRAGDATAANDLVRHAAAQLEAMARKMLRHYPNVGRWEQTDDVLQNAVLRLLRALKQDIRPETVREFFGLAAMQIRRELIDLARHYQGPQGMGANHASVSLAADSEETWAGAAEPVAPSDDSAELERWAAFHVAVEQLPPMEREVMGLVFYHGWTHKEIARLLEVTERTIRRYWRSACQQLTTALGGELPDAGATGGAKGALP